jgi:hypothetical protein
MINIFYVKVTILMYAHCGLKCIYLATRVGIGNTNRKNDKGLSKAIYGGEC